MTRGPWRLGAWSDGLAPRVALYLGIALLPLGIIAIWQTREYQREAERRSALTLVALTEQGAQGLQRGLEATLGTAEALGAVADLLGDPETCEAALRRLVEDRRLYGHIGVRPAGGGPVCSAGPEPPAPVAVAGPAGAAGPTVRGVPGAVVLSLPVDRAVAGGSFTGEVVLALPRERIAPPRWPEGAAVPRLLLTFDAQGRVLDGGVGDGEAAALLPGGRPLAGEAGGEARAFPARAAGGGEMIYTVAPVVPGLAYAMGVWAPEAAGPGFARAAAPPLLFPLLMWGAGLLVAFWAIHRLVIGRVADLGLRMRRFGQDRTLAPPWSDRGAPRELRAIDGAFRHTAEAILHDEARMENAFRERGVLLKEVHHRVKNNLQLISSIISMQVRRVSDPRTRAILRRLQDRVLTLAAIYRTLYTSPDMADVNVAPVLRAIVEQELRAHGLEAQAALAIDDLALDPDKAVPLVFLAAEAVSNALAHLGSAAGRPGGQPGAERPGAPELGVSLRREGDAATLSVVNSLAAGAGDRAPGDKATGDKAPGGLGEHLIQAFAAQVGGPVVVEAAAGRYRLSVTFPLGPEPGWEEAA